MRIEIKVPTLRKSILRVEYFRIKGANVQPKTRLTVTAAKSENFDLWDGFIGLWGKHPLAKPAKLYKNLIILK